MPSRRFPRLLEASSVMAAGVLALAPLATGCRHTSKQVSTLADAGAGVADAGSNPHDFGITVGDAGASAFEGELSIQLTNHLPLSPEEERYRDHNITFEVKGDAFRWNLVDNGTPRGDFRIYDRSKRQFLTVLNSEGVVLLTKDNHLGYDAGIPYTLTDTHSSVELNRHKCEFYETYGGGYHYRVCATADFVNIPLQLISPELDQLMPYGRQLEEMNLFPLIATKALADVPDGGATNGRAPHERVVLSLRMRSESAKPIPATEFELPNYPVHSAAVLTKTGEVRR